MPYGQLHYPFENKEFFEGNFPADFVAEGRILACSLVFELANGTHRCVLSLPEFKTASQVVLLGPNWWNKHWNMILTPHGMFPLSKNKIC